MITKCRIEVEQLSRADSLLGDMWRWIVYYRYANRPEEKGKSGRTRGDLGTAFADVRAILAELDRPRYEVRNGPLIEYQDGGGKRPCWLVVDRGIMESGSPVIATCQSPEDAERIRDLLNKQNDVETKP